MNPAFSYMISSMTTLDFSKTPSYITRLALAKSPDTLYPNPSEVAFTMKVEVNEEFVNSPNFPEVISAYVTLLNNLYAQLTEDFSDIDEANKLFAIATNSLSLTYTM
jgi:hypothetical protein